VRTEELCLDEVDDICRQRPAAQREGAAGQAAAQIDQQLVAARLARAPAALAVQTRRLEGRSGWQEKLADQRKRLERQTDGMTDGFRARQPLAAAGRMRMQRPAAAPPRVPRSPAGRG
jgi:hypothetical protein